MGSANKAFYGVGRALYREVKEGFVDVTVEAEDAVSVSFSFSVEDKAGSALIPIKGSGYFKGRVPWTDTGRALLNSVPGNEDPHVLWNAPDILAPTGGVTPPKFRIVATTGAGTVPSAWECRIMVGSNVVTSAKFGTTGSHLHWDVDLTDLIVPGTGFYFMVDYYIPLFWSRWAWSANLVMGISPPVIEYPTEGASIFKDTPISGRGTPGATVRLFEGGSGAVEYARTEVSKYGFWSATPREGGFPLGNLPMQAIQNIGNYGSYWSDVVNYIVIRDPGVP